MPSTERPMRTTGPVRGRIRPPGSKSLTNRALVCAALASGHSHLSGALDSQDTQVMIAALQELGIAIQVERDGTEITVQGCGGRLPAPSADLHVGNSGTTIRFLTAAVALGNGTFRLSGVPRMHQRPIGDLLDALGQLGADARSEQAKGCPPVVVHARGLRGGSARIRGDVSSQFLSGLLLAAPYAQQDVRLTVDGPLVSQPYVRMTRGVMEAFGARITTGDPATLIVSSAHRYHGRRLAIEPDASAATYFWAAAAITGGDVVVEGLGPDSQQGDVRFCQCLEAMGCRVTYTGGGIRVEGGRLKGIDLDMGDISDTVQTLAAVALFADGPTRITGVAHIRHKETDRIGDLARELRRLGAKVEQLDGGLVIHPAPLRGARLATYDDHRMAMSLALVGLRVPGVVILDPQCTAKTYPDYFRDLDRLTHPDTGQPT